ncbi:right-handed parallel beta-helix repeat-containing protein [Planosporangium mesophilum]|nr:right-handed parallel beta-helix repeat-containing protein [Planosporangium mesophilum]NJC86634.1 right-handed parallel beta-helix repeat-containing protein [Planosporangium mesophilum]
MKVWARRALVPVLLAATVCGWTPTAATAGPSADPAPGVSVEESERQASLVADEDRRLIQVRAVTAVAPAKGGANWYKPYRLDTGSGYTLVLTQQSAEYTIADLLKLAPETFVRQNDGSYLLTENLYLNSGAKLMLSNPGGLTLRLASTSNGFVSIVSFGGKLTIQGTPQARTTITSWDPRTNKPDTDVRDGRAYIRAIGGQFSMEYAKIQSLGFWSGRTGGLSLTGTDRPNTGDVDAPAHLTKDQRHEAKAQRLADGPAKSDEDPGFGGVLAQPSGPLVTPDSRFTVPGLSYVSGKISQSVVTDNAFGLFVSSANGIHISDITVEKSREDGVVMHRFASSAVIERTTSRRNGGDGFVLSRATREVRISGSTAEGNAGNGFTLSGQPLAKGPSASGESTASYGSNSVSNSVVRDNGHYGIEVLGGLNVGVQNNEVVGGDMGIVARQSSDKVAITGNRLRDQRRQGIALRDGVTSATVTGNVIEGADTAIYLRDSVAEVRGNTIQKATNHGVSLIGETGRTVVSYNVIAGVGPSAVDTSRANGKLVIKENPMFAWHDTSSFWVKFRHYASPMTMLWAAILLLILFAAVKGRRRVRGLIVHPYADKAPLGAAPARELTQPDGATRIPVMSR